MNIFKKIKNITVAAAAFLIICSSLMPAGVNAQLFEGAKKQACVATTAKNCSNEELGKGRNKLSKTLQNIIDILSIAVGIIAVIMLIIGGLRYITSAGDSNSVSSAKNTVIYAIVGLIIVAFAQIIVKFILDRVASDV